MSFGAVLNQVPGGIAVEYRYEDGKIQAEAWTPSSDGMAAFFSAPTRNNILWGHITPPKESHLKANDRLRVSADEAYAGRMVAEFSLPDPAPLAEACGLVIHKR